jgi:pyruvate/2-oxoglutarate dehydrogenase complex dihydrolipoamide acyltransferase (E2) component
MALELKVPEVGESITEVMIGTWKKREGDTVAIDDSIVEIESDKATVELPAPTHGTITKILKAAGEKAVVGEVIGYLEPAAVGAAAPAPPAAEPAAPRDARGGPRARRGRRFPGVGHWHGARWTDHEAGCRDRRSAAGRCRRRQAAGAEAGGSRNGSCRHRRRASRGALRAH